MLQTKTSTYLCTAVATALLAGAAHAGHEIITNKETKQVIETPEVMTGSISAGYSTRYIFRGTNLMPSADGMVSADLHLNYGGFTIGAWIGSQMGSAAVPGALSIGEGGGGGSIDLGAGRGSGLSALGGAAVTGDQLIEFIGANFGLTHDQVKQGFRDVLGVHVPKHITNIKQSSVALQDRFNEIDLYAQYSFSLGPVNVTLGNIFFYIDRDSSTRVTIREYFDSEDARDLVTMLAGNPALLPGSTRPGHPEDFLLNSGRKISRSYDSLGDEQFDRLFISLSTNAIPYIVPRATYYQTIYSRGKSPDHELGVVRNDRRGGYLELKINAEFPLIQDHLNLAPYVLASYSAGDRSDVDGKPLDDWNHFQAGAELVWQVTDTFRIIPQINWMNRIAGPPLGTAQEDWWGGARAEITFGGADVAEYELPEMEADGGKMVAGKNAQVTEEDGLHITGAIGAAYSTRYIFRGTNLMPGADGMVSTDIHFNYGGFTLGAWVGTQMGSASVSNALAIGEGGGGGAVNVGGGRGSGLEGLGSARVTGDDLLNFIAGSFQVSKADVKAAFSDILGVHVPKYITRIKQSSMAHQDRFNEIDLYAQYQHSFGPVDITLGNIFFYIDRDSETRVTAREFFDSQDARSLIEALAGSPLLPGATRPGRPEDFLINNGRKVSQVYDSLGDEQFNRTFVSLSTSAIPYIVPRATYYQTVYSRGKSADHELGVERNNRKGGYLELKVNGEIPLVKDRLNLDPYVLVSYSAGDRTDKNGDSLDAWNHFQVGAELVWQITDTFRLVPQINWMTRLADPPLGTDEDNWWGGAKAEVVF